MLHKVQQREGRMPWELVLEGDPASSYDSIHYTNAFHLIRQ
jgi:hypothetical protein